jgi:hypothetical protein
VEQAYDFQSEHLHYLPVNRAVFNVKLREAGTFSGHLGFCSKQVLLCYLGTLWSKKREMGKAKNNRNDLHNKNRTHYMQGCLIALLFFRPDVFIVFEETLV